MSKNTFFLLIFGCFIIAGCLSSSGYTPNEDVASIESNSKYAITYSVECISSVNEDIIDLKDNRIEWIKEYLETSGAFSDVSYRDFSARSKYHIRFIVRLSSPEIQQSVDAGVIAGLTLCTIPVYPDRFYYDISAVLSLNDELICAPSTSEKICELIWLPLLPALFYPPVLVRKSVEKKCYRYLLNEILEEHKMIIAKTEKTASKKTTSNSTNSANKKAEINNSNKSIQSNE